MTVTITITDPTADESRAVRAYLDSLHGSTAQMSAHAKVSIDATKGFCVNGEPVGVHAYGFTPVGGVPDEQPRRIENTFENATAEECGVPTAADAGAPDFDSAGLPWDERIHASSRATVADGTWRKKRGVSPEEVAAVEAELRAAAPVEIASYVELPDDATGEQVAEAFAGLTASPVQEQSVAEAPSAPEEDQEVPSAHSDAPPPPPATTPNPFLAVMSRIGKSKLDKAKKDELLTAAGALDEKGNPSILVLNKRPELIDGFVALLDSEGV